MMRNRPALSARSGAGAGEEEPEEDRRTGVEATPLGKERQPAMASQLDQPYRNDPYRNDDDPHDEPSISWGDHDAHTEGTSTGGFHSAQHAQTPSEYSSTGDVSQYVEIDDVLNFLSPSPRKFPLLKRKGAETTLLAVDEPDPRRQQQRPPPPPGPPHPPTTPNSLQNGDVAPAPIARNMQPSQPQSTNSLPPLSPILRPNNAGQPNTVVPLLSRWIDPEVSSHVSEDLSGPSDGWDAAGRSATAVPHTQSSSSSLPLSPPVPPTVVANNPGSPDRRLVLPDDSGADEGQHPTPVKSNRAIFVAGGGGGAEPLPPHLLTSSFDDPDDDHVAGAPDTAAASALERALALLHDDNSDDGDVDDGCSSISRSTTTALARDDHRHDAHHHDDDGGEPLERSAYEEALSLLADDSGHVEVQYLDNNNSNDDVDGLFDDDDDDDVQYLLDDDFEDAVQRGSDLHNYELAKRLEAFRPAQGAGGASVPESHLPSPATPSSNAPEHTQGRTNVVDPVEATESPWRLQHDPNDTIDDRIQPVKVPPDHSSSDGEAESSHPTPWVASWQRLHRAAASTVTAAAKAATPLWNDLASEVGEALIRERTTTSSAVARDFAASGANDGSDDDFDESIQRLAAAARSAASSLVVTATPYANEAKLAALDLVGTTTGESGFPSRGDSESETHGYEIFHGALNHETDAFVDEFNESLSRLNVTTSSAAASLTTLTTYALVDARDLVQEVVPFHTNQSLNPLLDLRIPESLSDATDRHCNTEEAISGSHPVESQQPDADFNQSVRRCATVLADSSTTLREVCKPAIADVRDFAATMVQELHIVPSAIRETSHALKPANSSLAEDAQGELPSVEDHGVELEHSLRRFAEATSSTLSGLSNVTSPFVLDTGSSLVHFAKRVGDQPVAGLFLPTNASKDAGCSESASYPVVTSKDFGTPKEEDPATAVALATDSPRTGDSPSVESLDEPFGDLASAVFRRKLESEPNALASVVKSSMLAVSNKLDETEIHRARRDDGDTRPPLFPKRSNRDLRSPKRLLELIARNVSSDTLSTTEETKESIDRWMLRREHLSFDPCESVFAKSDAMSLSPPGSPPVPSVRSARDADDTDSISCDGSGSLHVPRTALPSNRKVRSESLGSPTPSDSSIKIGHSHLKSLERSNPPLIDLMASERGMEWAMGSYTSVTSELGLSGNRSCRKRRGQGRRLSLSSRGSGRNSQTTRSRLSRQSSQIPYQESCSTIKHTLSEDVQMLFCRDDLTESASPGARSASPNFFRQESGRFSSHHKSVSSPDLQLLGRLPSSPIKDDPGTSTPVSESRTNASLQAVSPGRSRIRLQSHHEELTMNDFHLFGPTEHRTLILPLPEDSLLEEALMKFSAVPKISFSFANKERHGDFDFNVALLWEQLIANFRHKDVAITGNCHHSAEDVDDASGSIFLSDATDSRPPTRPWKLVLDGMLLSNTHPLGMELGAASALSSYLIGIASCAEAAGKQPRLLQHQIHTQGSESPASVLINKAQSNLQHFSELIETVAFESCRSDHSPSSFEPGRVWYSSGIKSKASIERKAKCKYSGDVFQVKDILRARIVFPDEGSLVAGLVELGRRGSDDSSRFPFSIARAKNTFDQGGRRSGILAVTLPTGYRHLLVNICLSCGLLAEIQFNLSRLFDVLGEDGHVLHQKLTEYELSVRGSSRISREIIHAVVAQDFYLKRDPTPIPKANVVSEDCDAPDNSATPLRANTTSAFVGSHLPVGVAKVDLAVPDIASAEGSCQPRISSECPPKETPRRVGLSVSDSESPEKLEIVLAMLEHGAKSMELNPRDVPALLCLQGLLMFLLENDRFRALNASADESLRWREGIIDSATKCLLRSLNRLHQAETCGMIGWLEYGSNAPHDTSPERQFWVLHDLVACFAAVNNWSTAEDALQATLAWCERQAHESHPFTLVTLLDLSVTAGILGRTEASNGYLSLCNRRFSKFLAEQEGKSFRNLNEQLQDNRQASPAFRVDAGTRPLASFLSSAQCLERLLKRRLISVFGNAADPIVYVHHEMVADAFAVLANCTACAESLHGVPPNRRQSARFWTLAFAHYQTSLRGYYSLTGDRCTARWVAVVHGLARCLRELGNPDDALKLLSAVVCDAGGQAVAPSDRVTTEALQGSESFEAGAGPGQQDEAPPICGSTATPPVAATAPEPSLPMGLAACYWLMAALAVDASPNAEGWSHALQCLRASSALYQRALYTPWAPTGGGGKCVGDSCAWRANCLSQLRVVEAEAGRLLALREDTASYAGAAVSSILSPSPRTAGPPVLRSHSRASNDSSW